MDFTKPVYEIDGKHYGTVNGLSRYLLKKHSAIEHSMIGKDRTLRVYGAGRAQVAAYLAGPCELGKPITLTAIPA